MEDPVAMSSSALRRVGHVVHTPTDLIALCDAARARGATVAVVPTMGALHRGHLSLIGEARRNGADFVVVTIFVNPKQFGPGEDLDRYPRTWESDLAQCWQHGVDAVFAPAADVMYPADFQSHVEVEDLSLELEGHHRPGHFRGVTTVVAKLFAMTAPCLAVFGRKDFQQWRVISQMARDLALRVAICSHPTVREADGLALSSRNRYLSASERQRALSLSRGLRLAARAYADGERQADVLLAMAQREIEGQADRVDYIELVSATTLRPLRGMLDEVPTGLDETADPPIGGGVLLVAIHIGKTRLIDNIWLGRDS